MRYVLDAARMETREDAHACLKAELNLPEYYGNNLDALYDCLTEMPETEIESQHLKEAGKDSYVWRVINVMQDAGVKVYDLI